MQLNKYIDHTLLKPTATPEDIKELCEEAKQHKFYAVCVNGCYVALANLILYDTNVKVAAVVGFPLGAMATSSKVFEAKQCIDEGADEIDMVLNIGLLKSGSYKSVEKEIAAIKNAIGIHTLKVILETCFLSEEEKTIASKLALSAGADFIKTSTGFGTGGATFDDIELIKSIVKDKAYIKASGGIKNYETAKQYIDLGVTRLGTSSGIAIVNSKQNVR